MYAYVSHYQYHREWEMNPAHGSKTASISDMLNQRMYSVKISLRFVKIDCLNLFSKFSSLDTETNVNFFCSIHIINPNNS